MSRQRQASVFVIAKKTALLDDDDGDNHYRAGLAKITTSPRLGGSQRSALASRTSQLVAWQDKRRLRLAGRAKFGFKFMGL